MSKKKRYKINKKIFSIVLFSVLGLIVFWAAMGFFLFSNNKQPSSMSVFPANPKQGDTVFIRVESNSNNVTGSFGDEKLVFFRRGNSPEWMAFLGIDADQKPGDYNILVNTSPTEKLTKGIKVVLADFSSGVTTAVSSSSKKNVENILKNDNPALQKVLSKFTAEPYFSEPFSYPLSTMKTSGFSFGKFLSLASYKIQHLGVDLRAPEDTKIYSVNDGKVVFAENLSNYGKTVVVDHGLDIFSMYLHLDKFNVSVGDIVKRGQAIGLSGETGYASGPHLHFSMRVGSSNSRVDPIVFINTSKKMNDNLTLAQIGSAALSVVGK